MKKCPACGKKHSPDDSREWLPFCSERCSLMDLGDWLGERHRIPAYDTENYTGTTDDDYTRH